MITAPNDYKETVSSQKTLSDPSQNTTPSIQVEKPLHDSNSSLNDEMATQKASGSASSTVKN